MNVKPGNNFFEVQQQSCHFTAFNQLAFRLSSEFRKSNEKYRIDRTSKLEEESKLDPSKLRDENSALTSPKSKKNTPGLEVRDSNEKFWFRLKSKYQKPGVELKSAPVKERKTNELSPKGLKNTENSDFNEKVKNYHKSDSLNSEKRFSHFRNQKSFHDSSDFQDVGNGKDRNDSTRFDNRNILFRQAKHDQNNEKDDEEEMKNSLRELKGGNSGSRTSKEIKNLSELEVRDSNEKFWFRFKSKYQNPEKMPASVMEQITKEHLTKGFEKTEEDHYHQKFTAEHKKESFEHNKKLNQQELLKDFDKISGSKDAVNYRNDKNQLENKSKLSFLQDKNYKTNPTRNLDTPGKSTKGQPIEKAVKDSKNYKALEPISEDSEVLKDTKNFKTPLKNQLSIKISEDSPRPLSQILDSPEPPPFNANEVKKTLEINQVNLLEILPHNRRNSAFVVLPEDLDLARQASLHIPTRKHLTVPATPSSRPSIAIQTVPNTPLSKGQSLKKGNELKLSQKVAAVKSLVQGSCGRLERMMLKKFEILQKSLDSIDGRFEIATKMLNNLKKSKNKRKKVMKSLSINVSSLNHLNYFTEKRDLDKKTSEQLILMKFHRSSLEPVSLTPKNTKSSSDRLTCAWSEVLTIIKSGRISEGFLKCLGMKDDLYLIRLLHHFDPCFQFIPQNLAVQVLGQLIRIIESDFVQNMGSDWFAEGKLLALINED